MNRRFFLTSLLPAAGALAAEKAPYKLPQPYHTPSATNRPKIVPRPDGAQLKLPQGFEIEEYASGFEKPRFMLEGPSGEILLTESVAKGKVLLLLDKNRDNKSEDRKVLVEGLDRPYGMTWWKDYLYVAEATSLKRYKYDKSAMTLGAGEEVVPMKDTGKGHWTR